MGMKNNDIKRAFDQIKADEKMKSRILENVYKEVDEDKEVQSNKFQLIYLRNKKLISALVASLVLVCGAFLYNSSQSIGRLSAPSESPLSDDRIGENQLAQENIKLDGEFYNFNLETLKNKATKIEIRNNNDYTIIKEVGNVKFIQSVFKFVENAKEKNIKYENNATRDEKEESNKFFDDITNSQAKGDSIAMRFVTNDNTSGAIRVYLDLNIICVNEKYYEISSDMVKIIKDELKDI